MRGRGISRLVAAGFLSVWGASAAGAAATAECRGVDLFERLRVEDPGKHQRVAEAAAAFGPRGRLFRVVSAEGAVSHLFGTAHLADARVTALPVEVEAAFAQAGTVVTELPSMDVGKETPGFADLLRHMIAGRGEALSHHLSPDELAKARTALTLRGQAHNMLDVFRPWAVMAMLSASPCMAKLAAERPVLDKLLIARAHESGKPVVGLEMPAEQAAAFNAIDHAEQVRITRRVIAHLDRTDDYVETMLQGYLRGEEGVVMALAKAGEGGLFDDNRQFMEFLFTRRNGVMLERALPQLARGGAFVAVGAMHLKGETGLVAQLKERGYTVERLL